MFAELAGLGTKIGGTIFGMSEANAATDRAKQAATESSREMARYLGYAQDERRSGLGTTLSYLSPYEQSGRAGQMLLSDALGVNGPEAQQRYFSQYATNPGYGQTMKAGADAIEQSAVGSGLVRSGGTLSALQEYGGRLWNSMFSDRLNRLAGVGQQGQQAAGAMAGFNNSASSDIAGYTRDIGTALAGGTVNASNADQRGTQNRLSILGAGIGQAMPSLNDLFGRFGGGGGGGNLGNIPGLGNFKAGY